MRFIVVIVSVQPGPNLCRHRFEVEFFEIGVAQFGGGKRVRELAVAHDADARGVLLRTKEIVRSHEDRDATLAELTQELAELVAAASKLQADASGGGAPGERRKFFDEGRVRTRLLIEQVAAAHEHLALGVTQLERP